MTDLKRIKLPAEIVYRNELLRSGKNLGTSRTVEDLTARVEDYRQQARRVRAFAVWVAIDARGVTHELARGAA